MREHEDVFMQRNSVSVQLSITLVTGGQDVRYPMALAKQRSRQQ